MNSKPMKVGIMSWDDYKSRMLAIAKGDLKVKPGEPKVYFPSLKAAAEVLNKDNLKMLKIIADEKPESVSALRNLVNRDQGNLSRTLSTMAKYGIVELRKNGRRTQPVANATNFTLVAEIHAA